MYSINRESNFLIDYRPNSIYHIHTHRRNTVKESGGNLDGVAQSTLREISRITQAVWLLATSADLEYPGTVGGTIGNGTLERFGRWYISEMLEAMAFDKEVRLQFLAVNQLVKPGTALFAPGIFLRVMKQFILKKFRSDKSS